MPTGGQDGRLDKHSNDFGCANSLSIEYFMVNGLDFVRSNFQMPIFTENDILGEWIINNHETCIFKKNDQLFFLNEYNDQARAISYGNSLWIKKWNVSARIELDKKVIKFNNSTKWEKAKISKNSCGK